MRSEENMPSDGLRWLSEGWGWLSEGWGWLAEGWGWLSEGWGWLSEGWGSPLEGWGLLGGAASMGWLPCLGVTVGVGWLTAAGGSADTGEPRVDAAGVGLVHATALVGGQAQRVDVAAGVDP